MTLFEHLLCIYLLSFVMVCFTITHVSVLTDLLMPWLVIRGMMSIYNELCWFILFSSECFETTKESVFTIKENALVVCEDLNKTKQKTYQFHGLEKCFCFHNVELSLLRKWRNSPPPVLKVGAMGHEEATRCLRLLDKTGSLDCKCPQGPASQKGFRSSRLQPQRISWLTQAPMLVEAKQC